MKELPNFHDAVLSGVIMLSDSECCLVIKTEQQIIRHILLTGVNRLRVDNFLNGNIILDVIALDGKSARTADILHVLSIEDEDEGKHGEFVEDIVKRIHRGELIILQVNPSYGCELSCLCSGWLLDPMPLSGNCVGASLFNRPSGNAT